MLAVVTKTSIFNHVMLVDANCDDSVTIQPGCGLESECGTGKKNFVRLRAHFGHPPISNPGSTPASSLYFLFRPQFQCTRESNFETMSA